VPRWDRQLEGLDRLRERKELGKRPEKKAAALAARIAVGRSMHDETGRNAGCVCDRTALAWPACARASAAEHPTDRERMRAALDKLVPGIAERTSISNETSSRDHRSNGSIAQGYSIP